MLFISKKPEKVMCHVKLKPRNLKTNTARTYLYDSARGGKNTSNYSSRKACKMIGDAVTMSPTQHLQQDWGSRVSSPLILRMGRSPSPSLSPINNGTVRAPGFRSFVSKAVWHHCSNTVLFIMNSEQQQNCGKKHAWEQQTFSVIFKLINSPENK